MSLNRKKRARSEPEESNSADDLVTPLKDSQVKKPAKPKVKRPSGQRKSSVDASESKEEHVGTPKDGYSHWLMKSEPESRLEKGIDMKFGIEDLKTQPNQTACWDGVRNYQARNFMREMKVGQEAFFYHSNCKEPGIAGVMKIVKEAYVDHTQFDKKDAHYDAASPKENPRWSMVDVQFVRMTKRFIPLVELKKYYQEHSATGGPLRKMALFTRSRLSVQPLTKGAVSQVTTLVLVDPPFCLYQYLILKGKTGEVRYSSLLAVQAGKSNK